MAPNRPWTLSPWQLELPQPAALRTQRGDAGTEAIGLADRPCRPPMTPGHDPPTSKGGKSLKLTGVVS